MATSSEAPKPDELNQMTQPRNPVKFLRAILPLSLKSAMRFCQHNVLATIARSRNRDLVPLLLLPTPRSGWWICDFSQALYIPSFQRWSRYRSGIGTKIASLGRDYGLGTRITLGPGDVVLDIGANVGEFAIAALATGAMVVCIEADPLVLPLLERNMSTYSRVQIVRAAAWNRDEIVSFYSAPKDADSSLVEPLGTSEPLKTQGLTVGTILSDSQITTVALLKCDAEGAEPEVLEGALSVLHRVHWISLDCGPERRGHATLDICRSILKDAGFHIYEEGSTDRAGMLTAQNLGFSRSTE